MDIKLNKKINQIRKEIQLSKKPLMFFDIDTDGSTSYLQLKRVFKKIIGYPLDKDFKKQEKILHLINIDNYDLIIIFDLPFLTSQFLEIFKDKKIIWVDHHPSNDPQIIREYNILHLNPLDYNDNDNRPSCYWAYIISDSLDNLDFVSLGSVSDFFLLVELSATV